MAGAPAPVAVIGAGIAGLAAAFDLRRAGRDVIVLDPADRPGGKLRTSDFAGMPLDESADTFLARVPWAIELCRDLGLEDALISPSIGAAAVVSGGRLARLPEGLVLGVPTDLDALARSGLLSAAGLAAVAADLDRAAGPPPAGDPATADDVTVGALVRQRLGDEAFEVLVDPLLSGVNAGRADELSAAMGAAQLLAAARSEASLIRGVRRLVPTPAPGADRPPVFRAIPGGMTRLVEALTAAIGPQHIRLGSRVSGLARQPGGSGYRLDVEELTGRTGPAPLPVAGVVLATPAPVSAALVRSLDEGVASGLAELRYASVALVALAHRPGDIAVPLQLSGFLVPRSEGRFITACSWSSVKFAHLGSDGLVRLRASAGRSDDERFVELDDDEVIARVGHDLTELMGIGAGPIAARVHRWMGSLPQYRPGHGARCDRWEAALADRAPGVVLAGASLRGLGVPACIASGRQAAHRLLELTPAG
jgi:oxygen-dependent protoporphyrinogen oxidase